MIAFDLDGTLVDSRLDLLNSVNTLRASVGEDALEFDTSWQDLCKGMPHLYATCFPDRMQEDPYLERDFEAVYLEQIFKTTTVYQGVLATLSELAEKASLAVVTNKPQRATEQLLKSAGLSDYFDVIVGGDRCEKPKPSPEPLVFARDYVRDGHQLIMVGDSLGDVLCGKASQALTVWCNCGYWRNRENDATFSIEAPSQLIDIVNANHVLME